MPVDLAEIPLLARKIFLRFAHDQEHEHKSDQARRDCRKRHDPVCDKHHDHASKKHNDGRYQRYDGLVQSLSDHIHVVGHARKHVADAVRIEIAQRNEIDFFGYGRAQIP